MSRSWIGVAALVIAASMFVASEATARDWPLNCKGPLSIRFSKYVDVVEIRFHDPQKAAGQAFENLLPGQCSWPDRKLSGKEVSCLQFRYSKSLTHGQERVLGIDTPVIPLEIESFLGPDGEIDERVINDRPEAKALIGLAKDGQKGRIYIRDWGSCGAASALEFVP